MSIAMLKPATLTRSVNGVIKANNPVHIQEMLVNTIYQVFNGNYNPMLALRECKELPASIRSFVGKWAPVAKVKGQNKYSFSTKKCKEIAEKLGFDGTNPEFELLAEALPMYNAKASKKAAPVDALASVKRLIKKLENAQDEGGVKEGTEKSFALVLETLKGLDV